MKPIIKSPNIPALEKTEMGQLTGGFIEILSANGDGGQFNNKICGDNKDCTSNNDCHNNSSCVGNAVCNMKCDNLSIELKLCEGKPLG